jgi:hypothetical protein
LFVICTLYLTAPDIRPTSGAAGSIKYQDFTRLPCWYYYFFFFLFKNDKHGLTSSGTMIIKRETKIRQVVQNLLSGKKKNKRDNKKLTKMGLNSGVI